MSYPEDCHFYNKEKDKCKIAICCEDGGYGADEVTACCFSQAGNTICSYIDTINDTRVPCEIFGDVGDKVSERRMQCPAIKEARWPRPKASLVDWVDKMSNNS